MQNENNWKLALVDLDGTLYRGHEGIPGAADFIDRLRRQGIQPVFFTNNAMRTPIEVCEKLSGFGIQSEPKEVCTSAQGAAAYLADRLPTEAEVLYVGTDALKEALLEQGLSPNYAMPDEDWQKDFEPYGNRIQAAVLGLDLSVQYKQLAVFSHYVMKLGWFVLTNGDVRLPSGKGFLPGNGSVGKLVETASGIEPVITGKPEVPFVEYALKRYGVRREDTVIIGDNLYTDIQAGMKAGVYSIQVRSGVQYTDHQGIAADEVYDSIEDMFLD